MRWAPTGDTGGSLPSALGYHAFFLHVRSNASQLELPLKRPLCALPCALGILPSAASICEAEMPLFTDMIFATGRSCQDGLQLKTCTAVTSALSPQDLFRVSSRFGSSDRFLASSHAMPDVEWRRRFARYR